MILGAKILSRVLVIHGHSYVNKFGSKTGGFTILKQRLKRWWHVPALWPIIFSILFACDVAKIDIDLPLDLFHLVETFRKDGKAAVGYPEIFPVIAGMLKSGFGVIVTAQGENKPHDIQKGSTESTGRSRSLSVTEQLLSLGESSKFHNEYH